MNDQENQLIREMTTDQGEPDPVETNESNETGYAQQGKTEMHWNTGDEVICNGFPGSVIRRYDGDMYEVRLNRGIVCIDGHDLRRLSP